MIDIVFKICSMPQDFKAAGNKSMVQLLKESGYQRSKGLVTKDEIIRTLRANRGFIKDWEMYSDDKRTGRGWYFMHDGPHWVVGYFNGHSKEKERRFACGEEASSVLITHEIEELSRFAGN